MFIFFHSIPLIAVACWCWMLSAYVLPVSVRLWPTWCADSWLRCPCLMLQCMYLCYALLAWLFCAFESLLCLFLWPTWCVDSLLRCPCCCCSACASENEAMMNASTQYISVRYISACLSFFGGLLFNSYQKCGCTNGVTDKKLAWASFYFFLLFVVIYILFYETHTHFALYSILFFCRDLYFGECIHQLFCTVCLFFYVNSIHFCL